VLDGLASLLDSSPLLGSNFFRQFLPENRNPEYNAPHVKEADGGERYRQAGEQASPLAHIEAGDGGRRKKLFGFAVTL
jgi:hypothetical protein